MAGLCQSCYDRARKNLREERRRKRRVEKILTRICTIEGCHTEALSDHQMCAKHRKSNSKAHKKYCLKHPEQTRASQQKAKHKHLYHEPYTNKITRLEKQNYKCANLACQTTDPGARGWQTDHDHKTGHI